MPTADLTSPENIDVALRILSWFVIAFAALWFTTGVIGYLHRRAYNLTRAESGPSKDIRPDFLKVDKDKRAEAIERGRAYDRKLEAREAGGPATLIGKIGFWSRALATGTALVTLLTALIGAISKIDSMEQGVARATSMEWLGQQFRENTLGAVITILVVATNIYVFVMTMKKIRAGQ